MMQDLCSLLSVSCERSHFIIMMLRLAIASKFIFVIFAGSFTDRRRRSLKTSSYLGSWHGMSNNSIPVD